MPERISNQQSSSRRQSKIAFSSPEKQVQYYKQLLEREGMLAEPAHPISVPEKMLQAVEQIEDESWQKTQSDPNKQELFERLHVAGLLDKDELKAREQLAQALRARTITALSNVALDNVLQPVEEPFNQRGARHDIDAAMSSLLSYREQRVIVRRFGLNQVKPAKLADIGDEFGMAPESIRRIESKALGKLREPEAVAQLRNHLDEPIEEYVMVSPPAEVVVSSHERPAQIVALHREPTSSSELAALAAGRELLPHLQYSSIRNLRSKDEYKAAIEHLRRQYTNRSYEYLASMARTREELLTDEDKALSLGVSLLDARTEVKLFVAQFLDDEITAVLDYASRHMLRTDEAQHVRLEELVAGPNGPVVRAALMAAGEKTVLLRQAIAQAHHTSDQR